MNEITQKLTRANIQRAKMQAEKYSRAKINTVKVSEIRQKRSSMERECAWTVLKIDRKQNNAKSHRSEQVSEIQNKAKIHNQRVLERINFVKTEFENERDTQQELIKTKLRNAAALRGSQLLQVKYTAEKSAKPRQSLERNLPVAFDIKLEEFASNEQEVPALKQRLEQRQKSQITIEDISEKLTRAQTRRNIQRE